jgi:hypothetical protein
MVIAFRMDADPPLPLDPCLGEGDGDILPGMMKDLGAPMKHARMSLALVVVLTSAAAQTSAPGTCFSFNTTGTPNTSLPLAAGGDLHFGITAPVSATIEQIDLKVSSPTTPAITMQVFQWTGTGIGPVLGSGTSLTPNAAGVSGFMIAPAVPVAAGSIYVLRLTIAASFAYISGDLAQPTPVPYVLNCGPFPVGMFPPCIAFPAAGTSGTWIKFRGMACGQTPFATAMQVGAGCGSAPTFSPPVLWTYDPPVLGSSFPMIVNGYFGSAGVIHLFWAGGPATAGLSLGLGFGCTSYLDPVSTQHLISFPGLAITNTIVLGIPLDPALAGVIVTTQALVSASAGVPTPGGTIQISNALQLSLGY